MIWNVSVGLNVSIDYDDIEADTKEEAEEIAKSRAIEDIDYNNCDCDLENPIIYSSYENNFSLDCEGNEENGKADTF